MTARLILGLAALAGAILFGLWIASSRAEERAARVAFSGPEQVRAGSANALEDALDARRLVPDGAAKLVEWRLLYVSGRSARARRLLREMLRQEPDNSGFWLLTLNTAEDPRRRREARARLRELNPLLAEGG